MFYRLVILFTLIPIIDLYLLYQVSGLIGFPETVLLVLLTGFFGAYMAKLQGFRILREIQTQMARGSMPTDAMFDGILVLIASVLLISPGVLTDVVGFLLLIPPIRIITRQLLKVFLARSMVVSFQKTTFGPGGASAPQASPQQARPQQPDIIDVEFTRKPN